MPERSGPIMIKDSLSVKIVVNAFIIIQCGSGVLNVTEIKMNEIQTL